MERGSRAGRLPAWYYDPPQVPPEAGVYFEAFEELSTERTGPGMPIPASKVRAYGSRLGLESVTLSEFVYLVRAMDSGFLEWQADESKRQAAKNKPKGRR